MPVGIGNSIGLEQGISRRRLVSFAYPPRVDHAIDDDMRHVNAFWPQLDCEGLGQAAHSELCAAECNRAAAPAYRGGRARKNYRANVPLEHVGQGFAGAKERAEDGP